MAPKVNSGSITPFTIFYSFSSFFIYDIFCRWISIFLIYFCPSLICFFICSLSVTIGIQNMNKFSSFFFRGNNYLNIKNIDIDKDKDINKDINS